MSGGRSAPGESIVHVVLQGVFGGVALFAVLVLVLLGLLPRIGWYRPLPVLSGSMQPTFAAGDLVVMRPKPTRDVRVGDVITYNIPVGDHHVESHRIVSILRRTADNLVFRTKGDANDTVDPWTADVRAAKVWTVAFRLPWFGWPIVWLRDPLVHKLAIFGGTGLAALIKLVSIWRPRRRRAEAAREREGAPDTA